MGEEEVWCYLVPKEGLKPLSPGTAVVLSIKQ